MSVTSFPCPTAVLLGVVNLIHAVVHTRSSEESQSARTDTGPLTFASDLRNGAFGSHMQQRAQRLERVRTSKRPCAGRYHAIDGFMHSKPVYVSGYGIWSRGIIAWTEPPVRRTRTLRLE